MTIEELLQTPLMNGARLVAGKRGLMNEVTWCASDTDPLAMNETIPWLLLLVTVHDNEKSLLDRYTDRLGRLMVAGIAYFESEAPDSFTPAEISRAIDRYDELAIPVIKLPRSTNQQTFKRQFSETYARYYSEQQRRSDWLKEICQGDGNTGGETMARAHGYNPDLSYYCIGLVPKSYDTNDPFFQGLEIESVKNHVKKSLSLPDARLLYYVGQQFLIGFFPWEGVENPTLLKRRIHGLADEIQRDHPALRWMVIVGSRARRISDFRASFERTTRTFDVLERLGVHERASFYDDWYMHMLLLDEDEDELRSHMTHALAPILDSPELLKTLESYLVFGENARKTSQKIGVSESTFKYRLRRVGQLLDVDLGDPQVRFQLRMALTIERYLRK